MPSRHQLITNGGLAGRPPPHAALEGSVSLHRRSRGAVVAGWMGRFKSSADNRSSLAATVPGSRWGLFGAGFCFLWVLHWGPICARDYYGFDARDFGGSYRARGAGGDCFPSRRWCSRSCHRIHVAIAIDELRGDGRLREQPPDAISGPCLCKWGGVAPKSSKPPLLGAGLPPRLVLDLEKPRTRCIVLGGAETQVRAWLGAAPKHRNGAAGGLRRSDGRAGIGGTFDCAPRVRHRGHESPELLHRIQARPLFFDLAVAGGARQAWPRRTWPRGAMAWFCSSRVILARGGI